MHVRVILGIAPARDVCFTLGVTRKKSKAAAPIVEPVPGSRDCVTGRRLIQRIEQQLDGLDAHYPHGNRELKFQHVAVAHLIAFFNPTIDSLRQIEDLTEVAANRRRFRLPRLARSTLSDAQRLFDPALLAPLVEQLKQKLEIRPDDPRLDQLSREILAVDGSFFAMASRVAWAISGRSKPEDPAKNPGQIRLDFHLDVRSGVPVHATVTGGQESEQAALARSIRSGCFYLIDRGFQSFGLLSDILRADSDFAVRWRKDIVYDVVAERRLLPADLLAHVERDQEIRIPSPRAKKLRGKRLRLVQIRSPEQDEPVLLVTNRLDLSAEMIGVLYRHRWQIELFFRWLKCMANFKHFFSESANGVTLQVYAAIIGTLLIALETQARPSVYVYSMMYQVMAGWITLDEARPVIERRLKERERAAVWQKAYNARKRAQKIG